MKSNYKAELEAVLAEEHNGPINNNEVFHLLYISLSWSIIVIDIPSHETLLCDQVF